MLADAGHYVPALQVLAQIGVVAGYYVDTYGASQPTQLVKQDHTIQTQDLCICLHVSRSRSLRTSASTVTKPLLIADIMWILSDAVRPNSLSGWDLQSNRTSRNASACIPASLGHYVTNLRVLSKPLRTLGLYLIKLRPTTELPVCQARIIQIVGQQTLRLACLLVRVLCPPEEQVLPKSAPGHYVDEVGAVTPRGTCGLLIQQTSQLLQRPVYAEPGYYVSQRKCKSNTSKPGHYVAIWVLLDKHVLQVHTIQTLHRKVQLRIPTDCDFMSQLRDQAQPTQAARGHYVDVYEALDDTPCLAGTYNGHGQ